MRRSLAALAAVLLLAACSSTEDPDPVATSSAAGTFTEATEAPEDPGLTVGGDSVLSIAADETSYDYDVTGIRAETIGGVDHVLVEVTITVTAGELEFVAGWHPGLTPTLESGGIEYEQTGYETPAMFDGPYTGTATGTIGFEAPPEAAETGMYRLEVGSLAGSETHEWTY